MISSLKRISCLSLLILFTSGVIHITAGEIYRWIDKDGAVHFSDHAPEGQDSKADIITEGTNDTEEDTARAPAKKPPEENPNPLNRAAKCTFTIKGNQNLGTGFFISPNGYAITCKHVIADKGSHTAVMQNLEEYPISVISTSDGYDLALILVSTFQRTPYIEFRDPLTMEPGDKVYAIGSSAGLQSTITDGLFTGLRKDISAGKRAIQFSAPVNPGNSGGPLIDKDGKVIGVISWKLLSNDGIPVTGIGFAVPSDYILEEYRGYIKEK